MRFELLPLIGAGPLRFGMSREDVRTAMGEAPVTFPRGAKLVDGFMGASVQANYDDAGRLELVEFARTPGLETVLNGQDLLHSDVDSLLQQLSALGHVVNSPEPSYTFVFPDLGLSFWREVASGGGDDTGGRRFDAIGVACQGYFGASG